MYEKRKKRVMNKRVRKIKTGGTKIPPAEKLFRGLIKIVKGTRIIKDTIKKYR